MSYQADLRDFRFALFDLLHVDEMLGKPPFEDLDRETVEQVLTEAERFAREQLAPLNKIGDEEGCRFEHGRVTVPAGFKEAYQAFCELGFLAAGAPADEGGMGLPQAVCLALDEIFVSANCAISNYPALSRACANMLRGRGSEEQKERYLEGLVSGRWQGTMCLTEPQAGSFVGAVRCMARPTEDGHWKLSGQKSFITSANLDMVENVIHFVLARTPDAPVGIKGISLFLVPHLCLDAHGRPAEDNDVHILGIEEKMGIHGSVTTTLSFGDEDDCCAELIGTLHQGIRAMFQVMNEERIQVGLQGQAVGAAAYQEALQYAVERVQGVPITSRSRDPGDQVAIIEHPDVRGMLLSMKAYVEGCRAMLLCAGYHIDRAAAAADDEERSLHAGWVDLLTPICKSYCSDLGFEVTVLAMQVFGGAGYVRESGVEQLLRDGRITSVYEGTNGMQAMDLLFRKVPQAKGALISTWDRELRDFVANHRDHRALGLELRLLDEARARFMEVLASLRGALGEGALEEVALSASPVLRMAGNLMLAWLLLREAIIARQALSARFDLPPGKDERRARLAEMPPAAQLAGKQETACFFLRRILPQNEALALGILARDRSPLDVVF